MSDIVLLDFDGVILNNPIITKYIIEKSVHFVKHKYKLKSRCDAIKLNKYIYKHYGHTALSSNPNDDKSNILEYNDYVFKNINYSLLNNCLSLQEKCDIRDMRVYKRKFGLFTNAPLSWCLNICALADIDMFEFIDEEYCFTSNDGMLKPKIETYDNVESVVLTEYEKIKFVDDSLINLKPINSNPWWSTYHMNNSKHNNIHSMIHQNNCFLD